MTKAPTVRMFNEYGCAWPFWGHGGLLDRDEFPLPPELVSDILAWTENFERHYDHTTGWPTADQRDAHRREGERLAGRVQGVVGPGIAIDLDVWETDVDGADLPWWRRTVRARSRRL